MLKIIRRGVLLLLIILSSITYAQNNSVYWSYTLHQGESLWKFADKHLKSISLVPRLEKLNDINNAYKIPNNTLIKVPFEWVRQLPSSAKISALSGKVLLLMPDGQERVAKIGDLVLTGASLKTGKNSQAILQFSDGSSVTLGSETIIFLNKLNYYPTTGASDNDINVKTGNISSHVSKPKLMNNRYEIKTPSAITAVRGTILTVGVGDKQQTLTTVLSGKVELSNGSKTRIIPAGYGDIASLNGDPETPEKLLNPPNIAKLGKKYSYDMPYLTWPKVTAAASYHVELYRDGKSLILFRDEATQQPRYFPANLADGDYLLKVSSVKANGLRGDSSSVKFSIKAKHPRLVLSLPDKAHANKRITSFMFSQHNQQLVLVLCRFSIAPSLTTEQKEQGKDRFNCNVFYVDAGRNFYHQIPPASPGKVDVWTWAFARIITAKSGVFEPLSQLRKILVKDGKLHLPEMQQDTISAEPLPIKNASYRLIISSNKNFSDIIYRQRVSYPNWVVPEKLAIPGTKIWVKVEISADYGYLNISPIEQIIW